jgi:hypothetical protein
MPEDDPALVKRDARVVRSRRRQRSGEVALEGAREEAVQHPVGDALSEADEPCAFAGERLSLCDDGFHERLVATVLFRGHTAGDALGGDDKATSHRGGDRARFDDDDVHAEIGDLAAQRSELEDMVSARSCQR